MTLLIGILIIILLTCLFGIMLMLSYDFFSYEEDKTKNYTGIVPGINCGICGYLNCMEYLDAVISSDEKNDLCSKDPDLRNKLESTVKKNAVMPAKYVAKIFCLGDDTCKTEYVYNGEDRCQTVHSFYRGEKTCKDACIGKGDCMRICPENAVKLDPKKRLWIDASVCTGCGLCIKICPARVIKLVPENGEYFAACSSHKGEKFVNAVCGKGCISCNKCDMIINDGARLVMDNNLAVVRYNSKRSLYEASTRCPTDVIVPIRNQKAFMLDQKSNKSEK